MLEGNRGLEGTQLHFTPHQTLDIHLELRLGQFLHGVETEELHVEDVVDVPDFSLWKMWEGDWGKELQD